MHIICLLTVVFLNSEGRVDSKESNLYGEVIKQSRFTYTADFSKDAKDKKYMGDYSKVLVNKDNCIEEERN